MAYPHMPDRCDYAMLREEFADMFRRDRQCVISADIDGAFSAVLLSHVLGWQVVGFYTLNALYVLRGCFPESAVNPESALQSADLVFLDHDIYRVHIDSIGHHLLQWSPDTAVPLHVQGRASLNPNLLRGITKREFARKYPFGTFHFLTACLGAWDLLDEFEPDEQITALLMHIDSSFVNAINYQDNALDWLTWLGGSEEPSPLYPVCRRMLRWSPRTVIKQFGILADRFDDLGIRRRSQASLVNPLDPGQWATFRRLVGWFETETGWHSQFAEFRAEDTLVFRMDRRNCKPIRRNFEPVIAAEPFSYAIISGGDQGLNYNWFEGQAPE